MNIELVGPGIMEIPPQGWGAVESLERIEQPYEVVILDADSRLEADEDKPNVRIIPFPVDEAKGEGWFKPH